MAGKVLKNKDDKIFDFINLFIISFAFIAVAYPLYYVIIASVSDPLALGNGKVWLWPVGFNVEGYKRIIEYKMLWVGYKNTIFYTVFGTCLNLALTLSSAYALSRKDLPLRNTIMLLLAFTMYFNGGLIPTYLLIQKLNLIDKFLVMILPGAVSVYNIIICRTFFASNIPDQLMDAAKIDGCTDFKFFFKIVLPLSNAIIAVMVVFYAVGHWNQFFHGLIYLQTRDKFPLQLFLREILVISEANEELMDMTSPDAVKQLMIKESMKYGVIIVSSLPVLVLYPAVQKYFVKGVMLGAIKT